jgi:DNA helicase-2/ATP-dependent DNA helicase PcrA
VLRLVRDYRSTPQVVGLANRILPESPQRVELIAQQAAGPEPTFIAYADEPAEAAAVAAACRARVDAGTPAREIAVLFRTNAQSEAYEAALADAGVAYVVRGGERFFDRGEVREGIRLLRAAARSADAAGPQSLPDAVRHVLAAAGWTDKPPEGSGATRERWDGLAALVALAEEIHGAEPGADLPAFVEVLAKRAAAQHPLVVDGVTLASLHAAKGLEWDAVFIVGLADGMVPISHAATAEQVDEERRLLYVGITRARRELALSWSRARSVGGRGNREPSRFLDGLIGDASTSAGRGAARRTKKQRGPARCRVCNRPLRQAAEIKLSRCAQCPSTIDLALFERLVAWRKQRAARAGKPAFTVFTDATLTAIAEQRPATPEALLAISGVGPAKLREYGDEMVTMCEKAEIALPATGTGSYSPESGRSSVPGAQTKEVPR